MENLPPWEPPMGGTEQVHLLGMLDRLRVTFRYKADGLDIKQLMFRLPSSELSLGGLLALQDSECNRGLNPPVSSNDRAI